MIGTLKDRLAEAPRASTLLLVVQAGLFIVASGCSKQPAQVAPITPVLVMTVGAGQTETLRTLPGIVTPRYAARGNHL